jgi:serine protease Do
MTARAVSGGLRAPFFALVAALCLGAAPAWAELPRQVLEGVGAYVPPSGSRAETALLQTKLSWIGHFNGPIDGVATSETRRALDSFQTSLGDRATGTLSAEQSRRLEDLATATRQGAGFRIRTEEWTGTRLVLPLGYLQTPSVFGRDYTNVTYVGHVSGLSIDLVRLEGVSDGDRLLSVLRRPPEASDEDEEKPKELAAGRAGQIAYLITEHREAWTVRVFESQGGEVRGIAIRVPSVDLTAMRPMVNEILVSVDLFAAPGVPFAQIPQFLSRGDHPGGRAQPDWYTTFAGNGSGSVVSFAGHILTNQHVVVTCRRVTVNGNPATLLGTDIGLDLALLRAERFANRDPVRFAEEPAELGDQVFVMGYPLFQDSQALNLTSGVVSSPLGYRGDRSNIQITAAIQPGNSGGPVFNANGAQVAVVKAKAGRGLRDAKLAENIAWVVRGQEAVGFLRRYGLNPLMDSQEVRVLHPGRDQVARWRMQTVRVECHRA